VCYVVTREEGGNVISRRATGVKVKRLRHKPLKVGSRRSLLQLRRAQERQQLRAQQGQEPQGQV